MPNVAHRVIVSSHDQRTVLYVQLFLFKPMGTEVAWIEDESILRVHDTSEWKCDVKIEHRNADTNL